MNEDLNPLQLLVAQHYANGIYASVKDTNDVAHVDEPLFTRLITEAAECSGPYDLTGQLYRARDAISALATIFETL